MRHTSVFLGLHTGIFTKILSKKYCFSTVKAIACFCVCLCLSGDTYNSKNIFENWVRPLENPMETQKELARDEETFFLWESLHEAETTEENVKTEKNFWLSMGEKQSFEGETRDLYPLYLTANESFEGLLWRISVKNGKIYAVIPEEGQDDFEFFYLIREHQAAMLLVGNISADKKERLLCYISVSRNENLETLPEIILLDYVKKDKNLSKSY